MRRAQPRLPRSLVSLLLAASLVGCAAPQAPGTVRDAPAQGNAAQARFSGKLSVQVPRQNGSRLPQGGNASFELSGNGETGTLELSAPTGSLLARASWTPGQTWLKLPDEERRYDSMDALTQELLGEAIPVSALFDWLQGRPWAAAASSPLEAPSQGFEQLGWRVETDRLGDGLIRAQHIGDPPASLRIRLIKPD